MNIQDLLIYIILLSIGCILGTFAMFGFSVKLKIVVLISVISICSIWVLGSLDFERFVNGDCKNDRQ